MDKGIALGTLITLQLTLIIAVYMSQQNDDHIQ